ncbi:MFS transporter [Kribbella jiaozuonensis]|uniref:MFS transporter n=1 Tax=Kribbella jiaozuonensis TaxID=2575441 RepID=A0A4U3LZS3_9ACTN|nr:MFS transporter [Kribbella jiaozuonensis]TKK81878.1 MFS transporter [Kribbella jiaozuonensis]
MIPEPGVVPSALAEPTVRVRPGWTAAVVLANVGVFAAWLGPIQVLLAKQSESVAPDNKEFVFGLVTGVGAAVSVFANPAFGAISDRTTSRFGRRVPWVVAGAVGGAVGLGILAGAHVIVLMLLGWCLMQLFGNALLAAATAVVPDRVPVAQRGGVGGWVAISQVLGALVGTALAAAFDSYALGYAACAAFLLLSVVPYLLRSHDVQLVERPTFVLRDFLRGFWISPRRYPDFGWAWLTRFLFNVGNALGTLYLFYYLQDEVGVDDADTGVLILTAIYSVCVLTTAITFGRWSDRSERRKVFVTASGWVMAVAGVVLAFWPTWPGAILGAIILGMGFGVYLSVDFALLTQVLPNARDRAKDLGVINIANSLPQVLAPAIAAPIVKHLGGYPVLYLLASAVTVLAGVLVTRIRSVN